MDVGSQVKITKPFSPSLQYTVKMRGELVSPWKENGEDGWLVKLANGETHHYPNDCLQDFEESSALKMYALAVCHDFSVVPVSIECLDNPQLYNKMGTALVFIADYSEVPDASHELREAIPQASIFHWLTGGTVKVHDSDGLVIGKGGVFPVHRLTSDEETTSNMYGGLDFTYVDFGTMTIRNPDGTTYSLRPETNDLLIESERQQKRKDTEPKR